MACYLIEQNQSNILSMKFLKRYFIPFVFLLTALYVSLFNVHKPEFLVHIKYIDKILHLFMYMSMSYVIFVSSYLKTGNKSIQKISGIGIVIFSVSFLIEVGQAVFTKYRSFELLDLAGNLTGIILSVIFFYSSVPLFSKRLRRQLA